MKTYRINKEDLKNKEVLAEGYKIFEQGFKARDYCYADENGRVKGSFHKVDGSIQECKWGLHFSKNPFNCFNFYGSVQWNEFAKVQAYENVIDSKDGEKSVAQVLEIVETYTFNEFLEILKKYNKEEYLSNGINHSYGINRSDGINYSDGINCSYGINRSDGINCSNGINCSYGINYSDGINCSYGINRSDGINCSYGINRSDGINCSYGINHSYGINCSNGINCSYGINYSDGINSSYGIVKSEAVSRSVFCYKFTGKFGLFNKIVSEKRINEVMEEIRRFNWSPSFNNAFEMKKEKAYWFEVNIPKIFEIDNKTAWSTMPLEMKKYIQNLKEYNKEIFNKITGDLDD